MFGFLKNLFGGGSEGGFQTIDSEEFDQKLKEAKKKVILDVRSKHEFDEMKIPNALNIDILNPNFETRVGNLDKGKSYFVYCQSGRRSTRACKKMSKLGFEQVYNLKGGIANYEGRVV